MAKREKVDLDSFFKSAINLFAVFGKYVIRNYVFLFIHQFFRNTG